MKTKQILVVDNEQYIQEVTKICLETVAGWKVETASSGQEGIMNWKVETASSGQEGIMKAETCQPDAILLDVMMPEMDGITTFEKLQENPLTKAIPVILLTAKIQATDRRRYNQMGMISAIAKPFNPLELAAEIAVALGWSLEK